MQRLIKADSRGTVASFLLVSLLTRFLDVWSHHCNTGGHRILVFVSKQYSMAFSFFSLSLFVTGMQSEVWGLFLCLSVFRVAMFFLFLSTILQCLAAPLEPWCYTFSSCFVYSSMLLDELSFRNICFFAFAAFYHLIWWNVCNCFHPFSCLLFQQQMYCRDFSNYF